MKRHGVLHHPLEIQGLPGVGNWFREVKGTREEQEGKEGIMRIMRGGRGAQRELVIKIESGFPKGKKHFFF